MCKEIREQFQQLYSLNVNEYVEKKQGLSYLSWANAWAEFKKIYPDAEYTIMKDDNGRCYFGDEQIGYMVYTTVTAGGLTYEMWLPVMDNANKSMKLEAYTYSTRQGEKTVEAVSMFDINKAVMRCLVKNLAMFGLGLYIYAGEDLPEDIKEYTCTDCGASVDSNMAERTKKKFGVVLCKECGLKRNAEAEAAFAAAQARAAGQ
jgi:DNA-directed RNA polymerase subunit RPC12/RpoP